MKYLTSATARTVIVGCALLALGLPAVAHEAAKRGRLVFSDHETSMVRVLDLDSGDVTHGFAMPKPNATLQGTKGGRYIVIDTGDDAGTIRFLDTGLIHESHGDHVDLEKAEVRLLDFAVTGDKPAHVVSGKGQLALFYDGQRPWERRSDPKAVLISLKTLDDKAPLTDIWASPAPQHGIAVPLGDRQWLMSLPNPVYAKGEDKTASSRPDGFTIIERGKDWTTRASFNDQSRADASCKLFHGHGTLGVTQVMGCAEGDGGGLMVISRANSGEWAARKIAYPDERRVSTIKSREDAKLMVGNYGLKGPYNALLRINPVVASLGMGDVLPVPDGQAACRFELSGGGARLANLTADGKLRVYDLMPEWKEVASFEAVAPFDCQFGAKTPAPNLAVIGKSAFVSDSINGRIREYHLDSLKQGLDMPVGGMPSKLTGGGEPD